jgi:hypothetical protein
MKKCGINEARTGIGIGNKAKIPQQDNYSTTIPHSSIFK